MIAVRPTRSLNYIKGNFKLVLFCYSLSLEIKHYIKLTSFICVINYTRRKLSQVKISISIFL